MGSQSPEGVRQKQLGELQDHLSERGHARPAMLAGALNIPAGSAAGETTLQTTFGRFVDIFRRFGVL